VLARIAIKNKSQLRKTVPYKLTDKADPSMADQKVSILPSGEEHWYNPLLYYI